MTAAIGDATAVGENSVAGVPAGEITGLSPLGADGETTTVGNFNGAVFDVGVGFLSVVGTATGDSKITGDLGAGGSATGTDGDDGNGSGLPSDVGVLALGVVVESIGALSLSLVEEDVGAFVIVSLVTDDDVGFIVAALVSVG